MPFLQQTLLKAMQKSYTLYIKQQTQIKHITMENELLSSTDVTSVRIGTSRLQNNNENSNLVIQ